jgi:hypothetical protein
MKRLLVTLAIIGVVMMALAGCGGGGTDGGWLATMQGEVYFLQISQGAGEVDFADLAFSGQVNRFHGGLILHNDATIEVDGMVDSVLKDCSACPYQLNNGNLVINYRYLPYGGGGAVSGTLSFSSADVSKYEQDVQQLSS